MDGKGKRARGKLRVEVAPRQGKTLAAKRPELKLGDAGGRVKWGRQEPGDWKGKWPHGVERSFTVKPGKGALKPLEVTVTYYEDEGGEQVARTVTLPVHVVVK